MEHCEDSVTDEEAAAIAKHKDVVANAGWFLCIVLLLSVCLKESLKKFHFPHTALLLVFGAGWGLLESEWEFFGRFTAFFNADVMVQLSLPVIIFDSSFGINPHLFTAALTQCLVLAIPGFVLCAALNAGFAYAAVSMFHWDWIPCTLFGTILASTDTMPVIEILKEGGVSENLITVIQGESMLNSALALGVIRTLMEMANRPSLDIFLHVLQTYLGGLAFGYVCAALLTALFRRTENEKDAQVMVTLPAAYVAYIACEFFLDLSGVAAVVVLAVSAGAYKRSVQSDEGSDRMRQYWNTLSFCATSVLFTFAGLILAKESVLDLSDVRAVIAAYFLAVVTRGCAVALVTAVVKSIGHDATWKSKVLMAWAGTRGAVGLALAVTARGSPEESRGKLLILVSGVIFLTLIFNASTLYWLQKNLLGMRRITEENTESMAHAVALLRDAMSTAEKVLRMDKHYAGVEWSWVRKVTQIENVYEKKGSAYSAMIRRAFEIYRGRCKECNAEIRIEPTAAELAQMESQSRLAVLRVLKTSVSNQHEECSILRRTAGRLNTCIENAIDTPEKCLAAADVKERFLAIPTSVEFMKKRMMRVMEKLDLQNRQGRKKERTCPRSVEAGPVSRRCIGLYLGARLEGALHWALLLNAAPVVAEYVAVIGVYAPSEGSAPLGNEVLAFEVANAVFAVVYVGCTGVRIVALGFKKYAREIGNALGLVVTLSSLVQMVFASVLLSSFRDSYALPSLYSLLVLSGLRLIWLLKIMSSIVFMHILNKFCSAIYNAYDVAIGFITAYEKIEKSANKIIEYEEFASKARLEAENNMYEMLRYVDQIDEEHPYVTRAWRTHRACTYILRNMEGFIREMVGAYMIGRSDAELLLEEIEKKMHETFGLPRYMKAEGGIRCYLRNVPWMPNADVLERIVEHATVQSFSENVVIQNAGQKHSDVKVLIKGIVRVSGRRSDKKLGILPNTDAMQYFSIDGEFFVTVHSPQSFGLLGYLLGTPSVTTLTAMTDSELISIPSETLSRIEEESSSSLSFHMWRPVALEIAFLVLMEVQAYENWSDERIKIHLEEALFPNLKGRKEFAAPALVAAMVILQGRVVDRNTDTVYIGPAYIPSRVRSLTILGHPERRARVVIALLREEKFHASTVMGWIEPEEIRHIGLCVVHGMRRMSRSEDPRAKRRGVTHLVT